MEIGRFLLNWGIFAIGIILFGFGQLCVSLNSKAYKKHVLRYGRLDLARKEFRKTWNKTDEIVILFARILLILGALGVPGGLLFFFTGIAGIGIPLWLGCTLGIAGIINSFFAVMNGGGFAQIEATMALMNVLLTEAAEKSGTLKKQDVLAVYASMLKSNPEGTMTYYIDFLFDKATMLEKSGKKQDALNIYEAIIEINPKLYDVRDIRIMIDRVGKHHTK